MSDYKVGIDFDERGLLAGLERAIQAAERLDRKMDELKTSTNKSNSTLATSGDKFAASMEKNIAAADKGTKAVQQFGQSAGRSFAVFNLGVEAVRGIGSQFLALGGNVINLASQFEAAQANFTTFLGSTEKANVLLAELNDFAAKTPFTQQQIVNVGEKLLAFGVAGEEVGGILQTLGDLSGGNAEKFSDLSRIYGQARIQTTLYNEDLLQLSERGIPIFNQLSEITGKSVAEVKKLASQGQITFPLLEKAFANLTSEGGQFFGLMERQSQTFGGLLSTLQGDFEQLQAGIGALLIPALKQLVIATDALVKNVDVKAIGTAFAEAGQEIEPFLDVFKNGISGDVVPALSRFQSVVSDAANDAEDFFSRINSNDEIVKFLKNTIDLVTVAFSELVNTISFSVDAISDLASPILNELAPALNAVIKLANGIIEALTSTTEAAAETGTAFSTLGNILSGVGTAISVALQLFIEAAAAMLGLGESARSSEPLIRLFGDAVSFLTKPFREIAEFAVKATRAIGDFLGITESAAQRNAKAFADQARAQNDLAESQKFVSGDDAAGYYAELERRQDAELAATKAEAAANKKRNEDKKKAAETSKKDREKAAADAERDEKERQQLALDLIEDSTAKALQAERLRYAEQKKDLERAFKGRTDLQKNLEAAERIHQDKLKEIQTESDGKLIAERDKALAKERAFAEERQQIEFEVAKNAAKNADTLNDIQIQIAEATADGFIARMRENGASEEAIQKQQQEFDLAIKKFRLEKEIEFQEALLSATSSGDTQRIAELKKNLELLKTQLGNVNFEITTSGDDDLGKGLLSKITNLKKSIASALKISPDDFDQIIGDTQQAIGTFFDAFQSLTQVQIDQNDRLIASLDERIEKQKEVVEKEKEAQEKGLANSLETEQKAFDLLIKQREDAEKRNSELQAKSVRAQLALDTAQQVSGVATSVVNIIKDTSKVPFVGIVLAAIQVASLFALLASARARARAATKLNTGGELPNWKSDENGQDGYHIADTGYMVGGGEFIVNRPVTQRHKPFLKRLNAGDYDGMELHKLLEGTTGGATNERARRGIADRVVFSTNYSERITTKETTNTASAMSDDNTKKIIKSIEQQTNRLIRNGFQQLQQLGHHVIDKNGNVVHYRIDPAGNEHKSVEIAR